MKQILHIIAAGILFGPYTESVDGYELQFATNYLGHCLLTHLLLPELIAAGESNANSRIVNVSSCAHTLGKINFEDINYKYDDLQAHFNLQSTENKISEKDTFLQQDILNPNWL